VRRIVGAIGVLERRVRMSRDVGTAERREMPWPRPIVQPADGQAARQRPFSQQRVDQARLDAAGEDDPALARLEHLDQPCRRAGRIQRNVDAVGLVDAQQRRNRRRRLAHEQRHPIAALQPHRAQLTRDLVRSRVELAIGEACGLVHSVRRGAGDDRHAIGMHGRLPGDQVLQQRRHQCTV
jgi:hypothetical protein